MTQHPTAQLPRSVMQGWSLEATIPKPNEIAHLATVLAPGTEIYLSTLPHLSLDQQIETAKLVKANGFAPVLHVAVRYFSTRTELVGYLVRASREVGTERVLVIAGDIDVPRGEFASSLSLIESGLLQDYGIGRVGIAGYPEGHPKLSLQTLNQALDAKLDAANAGGLKAHVVTQFCFSSQPIIGWLENFQRRRPGVDVRIGLAGPSSAVTLVKFAMRCGVKTPVDGLGRKLATASRFLRSVSPRAIITDLDDYCGQRGDGRSVSIHLFSFGGLEKTAQWMVAECGTAPAPAEPTSNILP